MKKIIVLVILFIILPIHSAIVDWDCFENKSESGANYVFIDYLEHGLTPSIGFSILKNDTGVKMIGDGSFYLSFAGVWLEMSYGDILDYSTMAGRNDYFASVDYNSKPLSQPKAINAEFGSSIYLGVMESFFSVDDGNLSTKRFGWIELYVDDDGNVTLEHSAMRIDAGPMIVGGGAYSEGIPEPTSGLLFLLGMAHLALRRKKVLII